jgi:hypothetical protein
MRIAFIGPTGGRHGVRGLLTVVDAGRSIEEVADDVLDVLGRPEYYALNRPG